MHPSAYNPSVHTGDLTPAQEFAKTMKANMNAVLVSKAMPDVYNRIVHQPEPDILLIEPMLTAEQMQQDVALEYMPILSRYLKVTNLPRRAVVRFSMEYGHYVALLNPQWCASGALVGSTQFFSALVSDRFNIQQLENAEYVSA